jgi:CheY-like chemotaxis protein
MTRESKGTILIIDDDLALQEVLDIALSNEGYRVFAATDGEQGLNLIEAIQPNPVLVISDIMMPNMDGVELFNAIKERLQDDGIPIILMTALTRKPWFADLERDGAAFLPKPFEVEKLIDLINVSLL